MSVADRGLLGEIDLSGECDCPRMRERVLPFDAVGVTVLRLSDERDRCREPVEMVCEVVNCCDM